MAKRTSPRAPAAGLESTAAAGAGAVEGWRELAAFGGGLGLALALGAVEPPLAITLAGLRLARVVAGERWVSGRLAGWERTLRAALAVE